MRLALITTALLAAAGAGQAQDAAPRAGGHDACFDISQREALTPLNDHSFVVRVGGRVYQVETDRCAGLERPDPRVSVITQGSSFVCGRLDYSVSVGEIGVPGSNLPCIVRSQRRLTPAEVAALPQTARP